MDTAADLSLVHRSRPGSVESDAPAVVLIHGRGANERDLLPIAAQLPAELHVLSVRAPDEMGGPNSYTWYDLDLSAGGLHASQPDPEGFRRSLDLLHEFVGEAIEAYDLDPDRIGLLGFSQGAITSYLAESHAAEAGNAAEKPIFIGCGSADQVIPPERVQNAAENLQAAGSEVRFETYNVGHGTTPTEVSDVVAWLEDRY